MNLKIQSRYKPKYKYLSRTKQNLIWNKKILKFNKQKWFSVISQLLSKRNKRKKIYNHSVYQLKKNAKRLKRFYKSQLRSKQNIRFYYGQLKDKVLKQNYKNALKKKKNTHTSQNIDQIFLKLLDNRLDTILYRSTFVQDIRGARQLISHGNVFINNTKTTDSSYQLKNGDVIKVSIKSHKIIKRNILNFKHTKPITRYNYLAINFKTLNIIFIKDNPWDDSFTHFPFWLNFRNIFSHYSY